MFAHLPALLAAFAASAVEFIEALTIVLAVGVARGWRPALTGAGAALALLAGSVALIGPLLARVDLRVIHLLTAALLLTLGLRWLRKSVLRAAGRMKQRDEAAAYERELKLLQNPAVAAFGTAFNITLTEGIEVVFIVLAIGAGAPALLPSAVAGALMALVLVMFAGLLVHRPLARIPENTLKFGAAILLVSFGLFWGADGLGLALPGGDATLPALIALVLAAALLATRALRV
ncbi:FTR1 family protein [Acidocella sp.]|uniref:FTR1 family protein n=1 Tax=Acidocella sp. TaxID=50710 RepID=UPI00260655D4|nr:FTR1 family protein [Acidocella sp.]